MDGINSDKVSINLDGGRSGGSDGSMAAVIAALGNRNQGNDNAALIAALGQRNEGHRGDDGFGFGGGGGILGLVALLGLLGKRGFGGGDDCGDGNGGKFAILQTLMENGADLRAAIPTAALETQKEVCATGAAINNSINQSQLASLAAFANLKDTVQNSATVLLTSNNQNTKEVLGAICALGSKIDNNQILDLQRQLGVSQANEREERHNRNVKEVEVSVSQTVNQAQAQAQQQQQLGAVLGCIRDLANDLQLVKQGQTIFNSGTMAASGTQAAANTKVN